MGRNVVVDIRVQPAEKKTQLSTEHCADGTMSALPLQQLRRLRNSV